MKEELKGLEKICAQYLKNIATDTEQLLKLLENKTALTEDDEKSLRKFGHQSYGSGSSYGFDFISDSGQNITKSVHGKESIEKIKSILTDLLAQVKQSQIENNFKE